MKQTKKSFQGKNQVNKITFKNVHQQVKKKSKTLSREDLFFFYKIKIMFAEGSGGNCNFYIFFKEEKNFFSVFCDVKH